MFIESLPHHFLLAHRARLKLVGPYMLREQILLFDDMAEVTLFPPMHRTEMYVHLLVHDRLSALWAGTGRVGFLEVGSRTIRVEAARL